MLHGNWVQVSGSYINYKYPGGCLCLLQHWNRESYTTTLTGGDNFRTPDFRRSFEIIPASQK